MRQKKDYQACSFSGNFVYDPAPEFDIRPPLPASGSKSAKVPRNLFNSAHLHSNYPLPKHHVQKMKGTLS